MKATKKQKQNMKEWAQKPKVKLRRKNYMKKHHKKYYVKNKEKISERKRIYYLKNKKKINEKNRQWQKENKEKWGEYLKKYYSNPEKINKRRETASKWYYSQDNKKYRKHKRDWENNKRNDDLQFRIKKNLRLRVNQALKKYSKTGKIRNSKEYGIDYKAIIEHLKPFPKDISKYHVDHIKPLCSFDLTNPKEVKKAFAPENHQWLLAEDNLHKVSEDLKVSLKNNNH